jgi:hypothetical protein
MMIGNRENLSAKDGDYARAMTGQRVMTGKPLMTRTTPSERLLTELADPPCTPQRPLGAGPRRL